LNTPGKMVSVIVLSAVDRGSDQTKGIKLVLLLLR